jgi:hypothetical protein
MKFSDNTMRMIFGFILAIGVTLTPYLAFGASQSFGRSGSLGASRMHGQHPFRGFGFFGEDGLGDPGDQVIIIQQSPPAPTAEPSESVENKIYVQPRWVDGGYGVQVLQPGYWTVPKQATER